MTDPLKPLTPEEQAIFDGRRESAVVIQIRCDGCGSWYETPKRTTEFHEQFFCDCGAFLDYIVPPMETPAMRIPSNDEVLAALDHDARLDTGMKVREAMRRAAGWWEGQGKKLMRAKTMSRNPFGSLDPDSPNANPSGIIRGLEWSALTKREKLLVIKAWHHFHVRKPDIIGGENLHKPQQRQEIK